MARSRSRHDQGRPGSSQRQLRVGESLRHALASVIERGDLHDPDLQNVSVTVTEVRISPDLRNATAYVMPLGGQDTDRILDALKRAAPFLRREAGRSLHLKFLPAVKFELDSTFDAAGRIDALFRDPGVARDLGPAEEDGAVDGQGGQPLDNRAEKDGA